MAVKVVHSLVASFLQPNVWLALELTDEKLLEVSELIFVLLFTLLRLVLCDLSLRISRLPCRLLLVLVLLFLLLSLLGLALDQDRVASR